MPSFNALKKYLDDQLIEINKLKWIESEKKGIDIGFSAAIEIWIQNYAEEYKRYWFAQKEIGIGRTGLL